VIKSEREALENIIDRAENLRKSSLKRQKKLLLCIAVIEWNRGIF